MAYDILLTLHIFAGTMALFSSLGAVAVKTFDLKHQWHLYSGRVFFTSMTIIFTTALLMSIIKPNLFLLLIAIFSFYLAFSGWRYARNRTGETTLIDRISLFSMLSAAVAMLINGLYFLLNGNNNGITLLVFAAVGAGFAITDWRVQKNGGITGKQRIARHLSLMLGGMIATVTAVVVVNFSFEPAFVLWLAPTLVILPVIIGWNRKLLKS